MHAHAAVGVEREGIQPEPTAPPQAWTPPPSWTIVQPTPEQQRALDELYALLTAYDPLCADASAAQ